MVTKKIRWLFLLSVILASTCGQIALGQAPQVVRATPDHADVDVSPDLTEIRIEFSEAMKPDGFSVCGGGPSFPELAGKPKWIDSKTFSIPVRLQENREYSLSINCQSNQNFRNAAGVPTRIHPISFRTAQKKVKIKTPTPAENEQAIAALRKAILERYSYVDLRKVDWNSRFDEFQAQLKNAPTAAAFARTVAEMLSVAKDPHVSIQVNGFQLSSYRESWPSPNFNGRILSKYVNDLKQHNNVVATGKLESGAGYVLIGSWGGDETSIVPALDFIDQNAGNEAIVIDVRPNGGGNELLARQVAGCFTNKPIVYSQNKTREPQSPSGFSKVFDRIVEPNPNRKHFGGKVLVLMGPTNMSSNESFLLMMRETKNCMLIGERSFGSSGNPKPHDLGNGVTVNLPSWQDLFPDGTLLEGQGIDPKIKVATSAKDLTTRDAVLEAAIQQLKK
jgi:Peptidase family S41